MNDRKSISDYKKEAKEQLLGNYGIATGAFALVFVLFYLLYVVLESAFSANALNSTVVTTESIEDISNALSANSIKLEIIASLITLVCGIFYSILSTGYYYILKEISDKRRPKLSDVFYCIRNHPDKVIIMAFILGLLELLCTLPSTIISYKFDITYTENGQIFFLWVLCVILGYALSIYLGITFSFCYLVYIDDKDLSAIDCLKKSAAYMRGNKLKFAYMMLSLLGYYVLGVLSFGVGILFVAAYRSMITITMYKDIRENENRI